MNRYFVFTETKQILDNLNRQVTQLEIIRIIILVGGIIVLLLCGAIILRDKDFKKLLYSVGTAMIFVVAWLGATNWHNSVNQEYLYSKNKYTRLQNVYDSQQYKITEGIVHVLHTQPAGGHDIGDIIRVGDVEFEINAFAIAFGYTRTLAHGGALTEGTYVRIYYDYDDSAEYDKITILRVDVKKPAGLYSSYSLRHAKPTAMFWKRHLE